MKKQQIAEEIYRALESYNMDRIKTILSDKKINKKSFRKIVKCLVSMPGWDSLLHEACTNGNYECVQLLIDKGADINLLKKDLLELELSTACRTGRIDIARLMLKKGANVNSKAMMGETPLDHLLHNISRPPTDANMLLLELLLEYKADTNILDTEGEMTPLMRACNNGMEECVKLFLKSGANVHYVAPYYGTSALTYAIDKKHVNVFKLLVEKEGVNFRDESGSTPLLLACCTYKKNEECVKFLLEKGADVNSMCLYGKTALMLACDHSKQECVKFLVEKGADINAKSTSGETALTYACKGRNNNNNKDCIRLLLETGAEMYSLDNLGYPAIYHACLSGNYESLKVLIDFGFNINFTTSICTKRLQKYY